MQTEIELKSLIRKQEILSIKLIETHDCSAKRKDRKNRAMRT